jgi:hypothetical protein
MKYIYSYRFLFESPNWLMNLLAGVVCHLVPVVGPMVLAGYAFEIIESLHRRKGAPYPDFDFNQLMKYLMRGLWPILVQLVVMLPFFLVIMVLGCCLSMGSSLTQRGNGPSALFAVLTVFFYLAIMVLAVVISFILVPFSLRAGLMQDFRPAFSLDFAKDFFTRVWLETLLVQLFLFWSSIALMCVGILAFCVGIYPAFVRLRALSPPASTLRALSRARRDSHSAQARAGRAAERGGAPAFRTASGELQGARPAMNTVPPSPAPPFTLRSPTSEPAAPARGGPC